MTWQDIVLSIGSWIFIAAMLPMLFGKHKPPLSTSVPTGLVLVAYTFVYLSLHLRLSMVSTAIMAVAWLVLAGQKFYQKIPPA